MNTKSVLAGLLGTTLLATAAFAQSPAATDNSATMSKSTTTSAAASSHAGQWRASKPVGLNVYNQANEKLGDISEVLLDNAGRVQAVVIGVGGFLGVGQRDVAIAFDKIKFVDTPVSSNTAMNKSTTTTPSGTATTTTTTGSAANTSTTADRWYPDHAVFNATKDELKGMPEFTYGKS
ncbi:PRC-barrel domain-containing protein [Rhodopseudomonas palustris]|nr:PRC-barrel domain-containing protein [Rhodopseudomonas palustris]